MSEGEVSRGRSVRHSADNGRHCTQLQAYITIATTSAAASIVAGYSGCSLSSLPFSRSVSMTMIRSFEVSRSVIVFLIDARHLPVGHVGKVSACRGLSLWRLEMLTSGNALYKFITALNIQTATFCDEISCSYRFYRRRKIYITRLVSFRELD